MVNSSTGAPSLTNQLILTAGPEITDREIHYGLDAIKNGWNEHYADYIERFEKAFAEGDHWVLFFSTEPKLGPLRSEPRFSRLLRQLNNPMALG